MGEREDIKEERKKSVNGWGNFICGFHNWNSLVSTKS